MSRVYVTIEVLEAHEVDADGYRRVTIIMESSPGLPTRTIAALLRGALEQLPEED